jgi:hypothetical protein
MHCMKSVGCSLHKVRMRMRFLWKLCPYPCPSASLWSSNTDPLAERIRMQVDHNEALFLKFPSFTIPTLLPYKPLKWENSTFPCRHSNSLLNISVRSCYISELHEEAKPYLDQILTGIYIRYVRIHAYKFQT